MNLMNFFQKHFSLNHWTQFKSIDEAVRKTKPINEHKMKEYVKSSLVHSEILEKTKFFSLYPRFHGIFRAFNEEFEHHIDTEHDIIKNAADRYFRLFLKEKQDLPTVEIICRPKPRSGAQVSLCNLF